MTVEPIPFMGLVNLDDTQERFKTSAVDEPRSGRENIGDKSGSCSSDGETSTEEVI
jgi:hypothetical protein